jgi:hypothetical protein
MPEYVAGLFSIIVVIIGLILVFLSARYRLTSSWLVSDSAFDEATSDRWRFYFFIAWTLLLPLVWLGEWFVYFGLYGNWHNMPPSMPEFTYTRKVISDLWSAIAVVLGLLSWNKSP